MEIDFKPTYDLDGADDLIIWRYLTIEKFRDLLETQTLYFRRMDKFIDEYEGYLNDHTKKVLDNMFVGEFSNHEEMGNSLKTALKHIKELTFVNCWHIADKESKEMWDNYAEATAGVVIKTTAKRLMASILKTDLGALHLRKVEYLDTIDNEVDLSNLLRILNTKQKNFEFEQELRMILIYTKGDIDPADGETVIMDIPEKGLKVKVDLNILVEKIYIHPRATKTDYQLLRRIVLKLTGKWLRRSNLNYVPFAKRIKLKFDLTLNKFRRSLKS